MTFQPNSHGPRSPRFDSLQQEAYLRVWRLYDRLKLLEEELFAGHDLSSQQYNTLRLLKAALPGTMGTLELASRLVSRAPDITRLVNKLEDRGLVERQRGQGDKRAVRVRLTPAGIRLLSDLAGPLAQVHQRQLGHMAPADLESLIRLIRAAGEPHEPEGGIWGKGHA
jgi:DNA-binding MarR family transcriptional regulator